MNYKRIIDRYYKEKHLLRPEEKAALAFYFDVKNEMEEAPDGMTTAMMVIALAPEYKMIDEEAGIIYQIGRMIIENLDKAQFYNNKQHARDIH